MAEETAPSTRVLDPAEYGALPWHDELWGRIMRVRERLPHALLLRGPTGLGKHIFAQRLSRALLCTTPGEDDACGRCSSCHLFGVGHHPDLVRVTLEAERSAITVEQVRELGEFLSLTPHTARRKVVILAPAERMNLNAANALLKLLEEPPLGSVFLLVSSRPTRLPATVRSRCVPLAFRAPPPESARAWIAKRLGPWDESVLADAGGAPLLAERLAGAEAQAHYAEVARDLDALASGEDDPLRCASRWRTLGPKASLEAAHRYLNGRVRAGVERKINLQFFQALLDFMHALQQASQQIDTPVDTTLLLEDVLVRWAELKLQSSTLTGSYDR